MIKLKLCYQTTFLLMVTILISQTSGKHPLWTELEGTDLIQDGAHLYTGSGEEPTGPSTTTERKTTEENTYTSSPENMTQESNTTNVCPVGYFGFECEYRCFCRDPGDICDPVYGTCASGCPVGWYGPGCIVESRQSMVAIVDALAFLMVLFMVVCFVLCVYIFYLLVEKEKLNFNRLPESPVGGGVSYQGNRAVAGQSSQNRVDGKPRGKKSIPRIKDSDIQIMNDVLGKGKFGTVNRGFVKKAKKNVEVAFKTLKEDASEEDKKEFSDILEMHAYLGNHENIIKFYGLCAIGGQVYAAFEYALHGNLRTFLRKSSVPESQRDSNSTRMFLALKTTPIQFALDVVNGMLYLISKQVVHEHLCAKHIMVGSKYTAKISGFKPNSISPNLVRWTAPEVMSGSKSSHQSDMWSFGVLLWEIMTFGSKPYSDVPNDDLYSLLSTGYRMPQPDGVDDKTYELMKSCWQSNPDERPSFSTLSNKLKEMIASLEFQANMDSIDDIDLEVDDDLDYNPGDRFGRISFNNAMYEYD